MRTPKTMAIWLPSLAWKRTVTCSLPATRPAARGGGYAEFATARESDVAPLPRSLLFEEAATLPLDGTAVWRSLFEGTGSLDETGSAFVLGAEGGLGHLAVQLALASGARVVAEARSEHRSFVEKLGAVEWLEQGTTIEDLTTGGERGRIVDGRSVEAQATLLKSGIPLDAVSTIATRVEQRRLRPRLFKIFNIGQAKESHEVMESDSVCGTLSLTF